MNLSFQKLSKLSLISVCFVIISQIGVHVLCQNVQQQPSNHKNGLLFHQNNGKFVSISSFPAASNSGAKRDLFSSIQENSESIIRSKKQQQKMQELEKRRKKRSPFPPGSIDDNLEDAFKEEELIDEEEKQGNSESSPSSVPNRATGAGGNSGINGAEENGVNFEEGITTTEYPSFIEETTTLDRNEDRVKETPPPPTVFTVPPNYNKLYIPKFKFDDDVSPVDVYVMLNILSVRDIDETLEAMTLEVDLGIEWDDGILFSEMQNSEGTLTKLDASVLNTVWKPDIYIDELLKVTRQSLLNKPIILKFSPRVAEFTYITRLTLQLDCEMSYIYYPADSHLCEFTLRSYSFLSNELRLHWMYSEGKPHIKLLDPYDPNFDLKVESSNATSQQHAFEKGEYNALKFTILARRKISFHMVQTYLPSVFFIVITWLCFLLPARMVEARIGITMTTLLTLTSMFSAVRESTPIVSYVKAIDLWMVACIFFIFLTLFAFVCLVWLRALREIATEEREKNAYLKDKELNLEKKSFGGSRTPSIESFELRKYEKLAELIERYTFLILAFLFLLFNVAYWSWLFSASGYYRHDFVNDDVTDHDIDDDTDDDFVAIANKIY